MSTPRAPWVLAQPLRCNPDEKGIRLQYLIHPFRLCTFAFRLRGQQHDQPKLTFIGHATGGVAVFLLRLEMTARPAKSKELLQTLLAWVGPAREARGCLACRFYRNTESEDHFVMTQDWKRPSDFQNHLRSEDFHILCGAIRLLCLPEETVFSASSKTARTEALERTAGVLLEKA